MSNSRKHVVWEFRRPSYMHAAAYGLHVWQQAFHARLCRTIFRCRQFCRVSAKARTPSVSIAVPAMFKDSSLDFKCSRLRDTSARHDKASMTLTIQGSKHSNVT